MATLMKLLEISIVASNLLGLSKSSSTTLAAFALSMPNSSLSRDESEKKATSEPLTRAEQISKITVAKMPKMVPTEK